MAAAKAAAGGAQTSGRAQRAMLFELEYVAVPGHQIAYQVLNRILKEKGAELTLPLFARYAMQAPLSRGLPALLEALGKKRLSSDKIDQTVTEELNAALASRKVEPVGGFQKMTAAAQERGLAVGAMSGVSKETALGILGTLGMTDLAPRLLCCAPGPSGSPTPEDWTQLAALVKAKPALCVAVTATSAACRTALAAGMRSVAVQSDFNSAQDFSGADFVVNALDGRLTAELCELLRCR